MNSVWTYCTVNDLVARGDAEIKTGPFGTQLHASDYVKEGIPVINVRNIGFGNIKIDNLEFISEKTVQRLSSHLLEPGDIVFGRKGAVERHAYIANKYAGWFQGSDCIRLRIKSHSVVPRYISYYFLTEQHQQWMRNQCSHAATMASLNQDIIARIGLRLPPVSIQEHIVSILSTYDNLIENNTRRIAILEEMARLLYREWFVNFRFPGHEEVKMVDSLLGPIPEGWVIKKLGDLADDVRRSVSPEQVDPETPYLGLEHFPRRSIALSEWGMAKDVQSTKLAFKKGEILFGKIRPYFHKVGVAPIDGVCSTDAIVIVPKKSDFFPLVLFTVSSDEFMAFATQTSQGTKMPRASWTVLADYRMVMPDDNILKRFHALVGVMIKLIENLIFETRNLRATRDLLLPRLISGEIGGLFDECNL